MTDADIESSKRLALIEAARRKAEDFINALHDAEGSGRRGGFNSPAFSRARDAAEIAIAELEKK